MRMIFFILAIHFLKGNVYSSELPAEKENKWQIQFNYARLYNYRYARIPPNVDNGLPYMAYLDTGHIATYSNLLGFMVQRKIWNFIHLQTGLTISRRGYLGTYVKYRYPPYKTIELTPRRVIFIPLAIIFNFTFKKKLLFEFGIGNERSIITVKEFLDHNSKLDAHSNGFFGYRWDKNRKIDPNTTVSDESSGFSWYNIILNVNIGYKFNKRILIRLNGNYSFLPRYYKVDSSSGNPTLNLTYIYETKPYIFGLGTSIAYSF